jgi:hypothetical protein
MGCGVPEQNIRQFTRQPDTNLLNYLDLCPAHADSMHKVLPEGVVENRGQPLLFYVHHNRLSADSNIRQGQGAQLMRALASRGERAFLAVIKPGVVHVAPVALGQREPSWTPFKPGTPTARVMFPKMALGELESRSAPKDYVYQEMFQLLTTAAGQLLEHSPQLERENVLSLVGRALFLRFLRDRGIVTKDNLATIAPRAGELEECFADAASAARTCRWLDDTFNGDFLPLTNGSAAWFKQVTAHRPDTFAPLQAILRGEEITCGGYQQRLPMDWSIFDFAHVPVGLLSQVYEGFVWKWQPEEAEDTSVHYTPRRIAEYLVDDAFDGLDDPTKARVLDPACGAGVFLVLGFRRLYREHWKATGRRPSRTVIRRILNEQLRGFDINEPALRLAALSLYLTALELDPKPTPLDELKFENLRHRTLFNHRQAQDQPHGPVAGSLAARVLEEHRGRYQLVIGNPPWTSLKKRQKALAETFHSIGREVLQERGFSELVADYQNPDNDPDVPFLWRAMQWCEPERGRLAFVLPGRLLFKQGDIGQRAREAIFRSVAVTGMLNCSNLSDSEVWPEMQQPFFLLFARNRVPKPDHTVRWVTVHPDEALNRTGEIRVDAKSIEEVSVAQTFEEPWLWKALALGTALDVEVVRKVKRCGGVPLLKYWEGDLGLRFSKGYIVGTQGTIRGSAHLEGLPFIKDTSEFRFAVDASELDHLVKPVFERPRERVIYKSPLVLLKASPGKNRTSGRAWFCDEDVAYQEAFNGFSAHGHSESADLARYLHLVAHSEIWMYHALLTSPELGAERRKIRLDDLERFPVVPWSAMTPPQRVTARELSNRLLAEDLAVFPEIDAFFAELYRLKPRDMEVIRDTLSMELPFKSVRAKASHPPKPADKEAFCRRMAEVLRPFFRRLGQSVFVDLPQATGLPETSPFSLVRITNERELTLPVDDAVVRQALELASVSGASLALLDTDTPRTRYLGILNHARYWTPSRARLCAVQLLWEGMEPFEGGGNGV